MVDGWAGAAIVPTSALPIYVSHQFQSGSWGILHTTPIWFKLIELLSIAIPVVSIGVALLISVGVIDVVNRVTFETLAFSESILRVHKYRLALLNCWPAMVPVFLWGLSKWYYPSNQNISGVFQSVDGSFQFLLRESLWAVWLVAVVVVSTGCGLSVWCLLVTGVLADNVHTLLVSDPMTRFVLFSPYYRLGFSPIQRTIIEGLGLLLIYGVVYLFLLGKARFAYSLVFVLSVVMLLAGIRVSVGIILVDFFIQTGHYLQDGMQPVRFFSIWDNEPTLVIIAGGFQSQFSLGPTWAILPMLNSIFWLFAHYFAFSWLLGRKVSQRVSN